MNNNKETESQADELELELPGPPCAPRFLGSEQSGVGYMERAVSTSQAFDLYSTAQSPQLIWFPTLTQRYLFP